MVHMVIGKRGHGVVAVIVIRLVADLDALNALLGGSLLDRKSVV